MNKIITLSMSSLFEINKISLKRIFSFHEKEGNLKFTDLLKLCSSTRIFPDLLSSPDLHKILVEVAKDPETASVSQSLTFAQFENFLRSVALKSFPNKTEPEQETLLFMHLKSTCSLRYSVDFETILVEKKTTRKVPRLNIDSAKQQRNTPKSTRRASVKPNSTKNVKSSSFLFRNSPHKQSIDLKSKNHAYSIISPRVHLDKAVRKNLIKPLLTERQQKRTLKSVSSLLNTQANPPALNKIQKLAQIIQNFKERNLEKDSRTVKVSNFAKFLNLFEKKISILHLQEKLALRIWRIVAHKRKNERKN